MDDPFVGTWTLNPTKSAFDANHKPAAGTMTWKLDADGGIPAARRGRGREG